MQRTQDRVDRCKDSAAVAVGHDGVCDGGDDADGWLSPNLVQRLINGSQTQVVDDCSVFMASLEAMLRPVQFRLTLASPMREINLDMAVPLWRRLDKG